MLLCKILTTELNQDLCALTRGQQECDDDLRSSQKRVSKLQPYLGQAPAECESKEGLGSIPADWLAVLPPCSTTHNTSCPP